MAVDILIQIFVVSDIIILNALLIDVYDIIVSKEFLGRGDRVLVIDDFLAKGAALDGLTTLIRESGAELVGAGIVIEKAFQPGGDRLRAEGLRVESLARVKSMNEETGVEFVD